MFELCCEELVGAGTEEGSRQRAVYERPKGESEPGAFGGSRGV